MESSTNKTRNFPTYYGRISYDDTTVTITDVLQKLTMKITISAEEESFSAKFPISDDSLQFSSHRFEISAQLEQLKKIESDFDEEDSDMSGASNSSQDAVPPYVLCATLNAFYFFSNDRRKLWKITPSSESLTITLIEGIPKNGKFVKMTGGYDHILALTNEGKLFATGTGLHGEMGIEELARKTRLIEVNPFCEKVVDICCGAWHSLALTEDRKLYGFGWNKDGQLGDDLDPCQTLPAEISVGNLLEDEPNTALIYTCKTVRAVRNATKIWYTVDENDDVMQIIIGEEFEYPD
ncbi:hypothetical protein WR25_19217 [Diploscapter pachys]|uniref:Uncharacterized protein n=1 Tax=Diploscapter pachys TaxID=2018661 RepID=A0A2A2KS08_9BILA|nr:hypothetical protein WR25_19217 [Diploscapter pachys]